jgi:hypothetical protein
MTHGWVRNMQQPCAIWHAILADAHTTHDKTYLRTMRAVSSPGGITHPCKTPVPSQP